MKILIVNTYDRGGGANTYLHQESIPNEAYVFERIGMEGKKIRTAFLSKQQKPPKSKAKKNSFLKKLKQYSLKTLQIIRGKRSQPKLSQSDKEAFQIGQFRLGGEIHQWMYDRYSLSELLKTVGFENITICSANESDIPDWDRYQLDIVNGEIRKPDSLFMEAQKP